MGLDANLSATQSATTTESAASSSSQDAGSANKRPNESKTEDNDNDMPSPPKKPKRVIEAIHCLTCATQLHPDTEQCYTCGNHPMVQARYMGRSNPTPAPSFPAAFTSTPAPIPSSTTSAQAALTSTVTPAASTSVIGLAGQAWSSQGLYLPIAPEAVEALRKGEYKEISHYLPRTCSVYEPNPKGNMDIRIDTNGQLMLKPQASTRRVTNFADLQLAHSQGLCALLLQFDDTHRFAQYSKLWNVIHDLHKKNVNFVNILQHYESSRMRHPGLTDCVGEFDHQIYAQTMLDVSTQHLTAPAAALPFGRSSSSAFRSGSFGQSSGMAPRMKVCMPFNDLTCTSQSCPLPHKCCRCQQDHASMSGLCKLPDPRQAGNSNSGPRGRRGNGGSSKYKNMGSGRGAGSAPAAGN